MFAIVSTAHSPHTSPRAASRVFQARGPPVQHHLCLDPLHSTTSALYLEDHLLLYRSPAQPLFPSFRSMVHATNQWLFCLLAFHIKIVVGKVGKPGTGTDVQMKLSLSIRENCDVRVAHRSRQGTSEDVRGPYETQSVTSSREGP